MQKLLYVMKGFSVRFRSISSCLVAMKIRIVYTNSIYIYCFLAAPVTQSVAHLGDVWVTVAWTVRPRGRTEVLGFLGQGFSTLPVHQKQLEGLFKPRVLGLAPGGVSDSVGLGWSLRICTSNQFPGDAAAAGPGNPALGTTALDRGVSSVAIFCMNRVGGHHSSLAPSRKLSGQEGRGPGRWPLTPLLTSPFFVFKALEV